jgi:hypothetical protein
MVQLKPQRSRTACQRPANQQIRITESLAPRLELWSIVVVLVTLNDTPDGLDRGRPQADAGRDDPDRARGQRVRPLDRRGHINVTTSNNPRLVQEEQNAKRPRWAAASPQSTVFTFRANSGAVKMSGHSQVGKGQALWSGRAKCLQSGIASPRGEVVNQGELLMRSSMTQINPEVMVIFTE